MSAAASPFSIDICVTPTEPTRVTLHGEFDVAAAPDLRAALARIDTAGPVNVVMRDVTFCDACTIGVLVQERERRTDRLRVTDPSRAVIRLATILDIPWLEGDDETGVDGSSGEPD
jgi:anti-anti-sigma factor